MDKQFHGKCPAVSTQRTILTKLTFKSHMKNKLKGPRTHSLTSVLDATLEHLVFSYSQENTDPWKTGHWLAHKVNLNRARWSHIEPKVSLSLVCIVSSQSDINLESPELQLKAEMTRQNICVLYVSPLNFL